MDVLSYALQLAQLLALIWLAWEVRLLRAGRAGEMFWDRLERIRRATTPPVRAKDVI